MLGHKRQLAARYQHAFAGVDGVEFFEQETPSATVAERHYFGRGSESLHDQVARPEL